MDTFLHSGGAGDVIYSLPTIKRLSNNAVLYIKPKNIYNTACNIYDVLKDLLLQQPYIDDVIFHSPDYPFFRHNSDIDITYNLDKFRLAKNLFSEHLIKHHLNAFNLSYNNWSKPWLKVDSKSIDAMNDYCVINVTTRYRNPKVNWRDVYKKIKDKYGDNIYFLGLPGEHGIFEGRICDKVQYVPTDNLLQVAQYMKGAKECFLNQSGILSIAHGLGKKVTFELEPTHINLVRLNTENENIL